MVAYDDQPSSALLDPVANAIVNERYDRSNKRARRLHPAYD